MVMMDDSETTHKRMKLIKSYKYKSVISQTQTVVVEVCGRGDLLQKMISKMVSLSRKTVTDLEKKLAQLEIIKRCLI